MEWILCPSWVPPLLVTQVCIDKLIQSPHAWYTPHNNVMNIVHQVPPLIDQHMGINLCTEFQQGLANSICTDKWCDYTEFFRKQSLSCMYVAAQMWIWVIGNGNGGNNFSDCQRALPCSIRATKLNNSLSQWKCFEMQQWLRVVGKLLCLLQSSP